MSNWLEQWVPFDFSNHSNDEESSQPDYQTGRFADWSRAPKSWCGYHPSKFDTQTEGNMSRTIFRSLSLDARIGSIKKEDINVILLTGGTGLTGRDSTPEAVKKILDKEIPGFGEIFRYVSFKKIGTSSLQSRAIAGLANGKFIFALPGSPGACKDAWNDILKYQLDSRTKPCNLVELIPRIFEKEKPN